MIGTMKNYNPRLPDILPEAAREPEDFKRRAFTVRTLSGFAIEAVRNEYGENIADAYGDELWQYSELSRFSVDKAGHPSGTAPQVFRRWYNLTSQELDLLPITFESAKRSTYELSLLGAAVVSQAIKTPVSKQLLGDYHAYRLEQLTAQA